MTQHDWLAAEFEEHRDHLRAVAYRLLGSASDAEDAVQDTWLRLTGADTSGVENLGGWLTTVVARVSLNMLRSRRHRQEDPVGDTWTGAAEQAARAAADGPGAAAPASLPADPEDEAVLADSVGLALLVVLDTLSPAERLAFVLHDMFDLPFEDIAGLAGRTPAAVRQLASRARRRVRGAGVPDPDPDLARQREVVDAFFAAARGGDFDALVAVLDPRVVLRADTGAALPEAALLIHGAEAVARQALTGLARVISRPGLHLHPALVNGAAGVIVTMRGRPVTVVGFTVAGGRIVEIDAIADAERVRRITAAALGDG